MCRFFFRAEETTTEIFTQMICMTNKYDIRVRTKIAISSSSVTWTTSLTSCHFDQDNIITCQIGILMIDEFTKKVRFRRVANQPAKKLGNQGW